MMPSKQPIFEVSGSKNHTLSGMWDQSHYILGTWTLWVRVGSWGRGWCLLPLSMKVPPLVATEKNRPTSAEHRTGLTSKH